MYETCSISNLSCGNVMTRHPPSAGLSDRSPFSMPPNALSPETSTTRLLVPLLELDVLFEGGSRTLPGWVEEDVVKRKSVYEAVMRCGGDGGKKRGKEWKI